MNGLKIDKFKKWLINKGCEILPATNEYETLRFRGRETGVLYTTGRVSNKYTNQAIIAFMGNTKWDGGPVNVGRKSNYKKQKVYLLKRDGTDCFYCGKPMADDITVEHLIALVKGGKNNLENMVLAHEKCNNEADVLPISDKVRIAIKNRSELKPVKNIIQKLK